MANLPKSGLSGSGYLSQRTIAALASGHGGAIALIRASGPESGQILQELTGRASSFVPRHMTRCPLFGGGGERLDDALVCFYPTQESFTGEESFELFLHGGEIVIQKVLDCLRQLGAGKALPGEFSFRAVRNGKMTVVQAQAVSDLITAQSDRAHELAIEKLVGGQRERVLKLAEALRRLMTMGELGIDFSDQDVAELSLVRLKKDAAVLREDLARLEATFERGRRIQQGVSVAILGLPNAGKSSLFNALLGEDRSIVTPVAGTTRDVVRETLTVKGAEGSVLLRLSDTAGLRSTQDEIESLGIDRSLNAAQQSDVVIWVIDPQTQDEGLRVLREWASLSRQSTAQKLHVVVVTKGDLVSDGQIPVLIQDWAKQIGAVACCLVSARDFTGIEELSALLAGACSGWMGRKPGEWILTSEIQREAVGAAVQDLDRALSAPEYEFFAADIRQAAQSLAPLIGQTPTDEILGRIFSQFCIGK